MNKIEVYEFLKKKNLSYEVTEHEAVYNMEELSRIDLPYPTRDAKNLFVKDDKKRNYYLISLKGKKRLDLKEFRKRHETRPLSFASEEDLESRLGLSRGAVSPLGLLNDDSQSVIFYLDEEFLQEEGIIGIHPNENTATVWLKTEDLVTLIREHGNPVHIVSF